MLAADDATITLEGEARARVVILKFASEEAARAWYNCDEYGAVRPLRLALAR